MDKNERHPFGFAKLPETEPAMRVDEMVREWRKGCSCDTLTLHDGERESYPGFCRECTDGLHTAILSRLETARRLGEEP